MSPQELWDIIKARIKKFVKGYSRQRVDWRKQQLIALQRKRQRLLRQAIPTSILERGETDAGYLKKSASARQAQRSVPMLRNLATGDICSNQEQMLEVTQHFYANLYATEPICLDSVERMVSHIPDACSLDESDANFLMSPFGIDEIVAQGSRAPKSSSPDSDGLSYAFLNLLFQQPQYTELIVRVFNDVLSKSLFPPSWLETSVCLLSKKGNLTSLKNWRPITLINCDAKIFTRLLNTRLASIISPLISPNQSGFMKERFIADNGALAQIACEQASACQSGEVGLLCDQEKAYDRVHPTYLRAFLTRFGFPMGFIDSISSLFFGTSMKVNVNDYLTQPVPLGRGLRQGDPISPLLFNLVMEPLIKSIIQSDRIQGFLPPNISRPYLDSFTLPLLSVLAYADDLLIFLKDVHDLAEVQQLISCYNRASNAKMNYDETVAFSVSGRPHPHWLPALQSYGISKWHDRNDPVPLTHLDYPLIFSASQGIFFKNALFKQLVALVIFINNVNCRCKAVQRFLIL
ncbi:hypothetical protein G6F55_010897 [Rhizopus delemar]|nr:hypothetical protein G6F55_010897 [Rhizopus delemar]KAG1535186.1 hypothetical protein G6F51_011673 [Rhizopus arrhizus]KAG1488956.1 hypothetical protein G6F54_011787 [Rhizopus delemar]KAG1550196.1 hypothetical protein G6F49_009368 [Rhizopus delemar]KAG1564159.1 hypothetical protein G6F50_011293 [Rhizopus delemar]